MKLVILVLIIFLILNNLGKKEDFRSFNRISNYYYINLDRHQDRRKYMENQIRIRNFRWINIIYVNNK